MNSTLDQFYNDKLLFSSTSPVDGVQYDTTDASDGFMNSTHELSFVGALTVLSDVVHDDPGRPTLAKFNFDPHNDLTPSPVLEDIIKGSMTNSKEEQKSLFDHEGYPLIGDIPVLNRKIFRGIRVSIMEHPYMASIRRKYAHYLTGAIITPHVVISVAHPLHDVPTYELGVVTGENYSDRGAVLQTVVFVVIHEDFDPYTLEADLALLYVHEAIVHKSNQKPIALFDGNSLSLERQPMDDNIAFVTGWGRCDFTGKELCLPRSSKYVRDEIMDPMLRTVTIDFVPPWKNYYCVGYQKHQLKIRQGMLCAGTAREEQVLAPCMAVPGAPLVLRGKLLGLQSWGFGCGFTHDLPLIYTNIQDYRSWILHNTAILNQSIPNKLLDLYLATKAYIIEGWLKRTREVTPVYAPRVDHPLQVTGSDKTLVNLKGHVIDFRDYINDGEYRLVKAEMYQTMRYQLLKQRKYEEIRSNLSLRENKPFLNKSILREYVDLPLRNNSENTFDNYDESYSATTE